MTLKEQIVAANKAYRIGRPIMSDLEFDNLCEQYEKQVSKEEYDAFRNSLHEETGKVKHPFVMGSLDKLKIEEPEKIFDWIKKYKIETLSVSAKVDGISCRLHYNKEGEFVSATTRGDGYAGVDITDKVKYVKGIPSLPYLKNEIDIRGELVITNEDFIPLAKTLKNPRNACAGIMGQKNADPELLKHVSFIAYEIMGGKIEKDVQLDILENHMGFNVVPHVELPLKDYVHLKDKLKKILEFWIKKDYGFPTDGIVVSDVLYKAEDEYRPKAQKAVKIANMFGAESVLLDVLWDKPSKNGRITPVGIIEPVDIDGATVTKVTLNNLDWMNQMNLKIGSHVTVVRSNGVIPKIIDVRNDGSEVAIKIPEVCPYCESKLERVGVDICCMNKDCSASGYARIRNFLERIGIKHVSLKTLENLGIENFVDLLAFKADKNYKVQVRFENDLYNALFGSDEVTVFKALPFKNVAEKTLTKIIDFYGWDWLNMKFGGDPSHFWDYKDGLPVGIGEKTLEAFEEYATSNFLILEKIMNDKRWHGKTFEQINNNKKDTDMKSTGKSVCFTGKLDTFTRKEASEFAEMHGFTVLNAVTKDLTYLVTNDTDSGSSKNRKAAQLGIKVINEKKFINLCEGL